MFGLNPVELIVWFFLIAGADLVAVVAEYRWFKPADTKAMAKQVKKLLKENLPKREVQKVIKAIDKAEEIHAEEEK
jgi:uncharacterized protein (DUF1697 family)